MYDYKVEVLQELELLSAQGLIDLFYGDQAQVCSEGYVPYGWQFPEEEVSKGAQKGFRLNCWGLIWRANDCHWAITTHTIDAAFILEKLEQLTWLSTKPTYVVLDNAKIHHAKLIQQRLTAWQNRGLYLCFLPAYSPHLNIAETMWRQLKGGWLRSQDYLDNHTLAYALNRCMANIGASLTINFKPFIVNNAN